ncbi:23S rRNA (adenine(1618)-N(6))-methyltransferase RlmF [Amphritea japonica]|uniref:Ribosomal RNA large subunit methyltransferase F n=1 Tax=Amphritea japonica ATCC BAA-1530 TaxID=1278309 RepID=A0A7R6SSS7_9GAMM|nr:23S rRNA (adenine(1618)-N(6))-methyltransferase RlmF [Amphritea japonica]BBB26560.1 23S rRNA (adenine1618-N6)-methyltransferase [Amphritea japonica ATCC BAA-1530]
MSKALKGKGPKAALLHPRNPHQGRYDFEALGRLSADLKGFILLNRFDEESIDFHNPDAVKALNKALLLQNYGIHFWDIPPGYLCPPIPGRADYIHYLADQLAADNQGVIPSGRRIRGLDIGVGANCIYPLIGSRSYGWQFVGADIDPVAVNGANLIVEANPVVKGRIENRLQTDSESMFKGVVNPSEQFDFTLCNPPFHGSAEEAESGTRRKLKNLGKESSDITLNFGGRQNELWCKGGELAFIKRMILQSREFGEQCYLFSCLISRQDNIAPIKRILKSVSAKNVRVIDMAQGQKSSRFVVWTFLSKAEQADWRQLRWGDK